MPWYVQHLFHTRVWTRPSHYHTFVPLQDPVLSSVTDLPSKINVNTNPDDPVNAGIKVTSGSDPNSKPDNLNLGAGVGLCLDIGGTGCGHSSSTPTPTPSHVSSSPLTPTPTGPWCNTAGMRRLFLLFILLITPSRLTRPMSWHLGCNENDIWVWLNDLNAKILVCLDLLGEPSFQTSVFQFTQSLLSDGKNDPQDPVSKIIAEVNAAIALLVNIKVDLTHNHGGKCDDIIKLLVDLLVVSIICLCS